MAYRWPLRCEADRFALDLFRAAARDLPPERAEVFPFDGEFMISRSEAIRLGGNPSRRPISSGEGTRLVTTTVSMGILWPKSCAKCILQEFWLDEGGSPPWLW